MRKKLHHHISRLWWSLKKYLLESKRFQVLFILSGILPLIALGIFTFVAVYQNGTTAALIRRESLGKSIAKLAEERFDFLILQGIHYASHPQFQRLIRQKKWEEALSSLVAEQKPMYSAIDRIVLFDIDSTAEADYPHVPDFENVKGNKFSDRDWYLGVSRNWQPYVSEIFKRTTEPQINIVSVVIPIKSILGEESGRILGILNFTISLDNFYDWSKSLNTDPYSVLYFVDQKGQVIGDLYYSSDGKIVNYANVPAIQRLLQGEEGVDVLLNPLENKERVSAYYKIGTYDWGVVVAQETVEAFRERDNQLRQITLFIIIFILVSASILYVLYRLFVLVHKYRSQERIFLENIGEGIFVLNKDLKVILWNKTAAVITGYPESEIVDKPFSQTIKLLERNKKEIMNLITKTWETGKQIFLPKIIYFFSRSGAKIPVRVIVAPVVSNKGKIANVIVTFRDVSKLIELDQAKDEFISIAAHQLRTPLGVMRWNIELLLKEKFGGITKETKGALEDMFNNNLDLIRLVNDLLDISRINQEKVINTPQDIHILQIVEKVMKEEEQEIKKKKISIKIVQSKEQIPKIHADPNLLEQVVKNLISNAIKYNRYHGSIDVLVEKREKVVRLTVIDTGIGIPKKDLERVFEKFNRSDNAVSLGIAGSGLGLFVVKSYIKILKGNVWLESEEGKGTKAIIEIPYK